MTAAGFFFHFVISYAFTGVYFALGSRFAWLSRKPLLAALLFGTAVWAVMNLVVVPLAFSRPFRLNLVPVARGHAILVVCFALPITLLARRYFEGRKSA